MSEHIKAFLKELGLDLEDDNLRDTPSRITRMFKDELLKNRDCVFAGFTCFPNNKGYNQIIGIECVEFVSVCSHHFLPFHGKSWFYYIPNDKLVGASKPARCIVHYSKKPQLQEDLCHEILSCFCETIKPKGAMIYMRGTHGCISHRGVQQANTRMTTSAVWGSFLKNSELELKALQMVQISLLDR